VCQPFAPLADKGVFEVLLHDAVGPREHLRFIVWVRPAEADAALPPVWLLQVVDKEGDEYSEEEVEVIRRRMAALS
jgi:hypothetical protein